MNGIFEFNGIGYFSDYNGKYGWSSSTNSLENIAATGANSVAIVPTWYTTSFKSDDFHADPISTEADANVVKAISDAHNNGLQVLLKPHVDPQDGNYRGTFAPIDVTSWFQNYGKMIVHYAQIAQETHSEMLSIGCEFSSLSGAQYQSQWNQIIADVREVYSGPITYAADWGEAGKVSFWNAVDYIGIDAYNPLPTEGKPTVKKLAAEWTSVPSGPGYPSWEVDVTGGKSPVEYYHQLSTTYSKPVIFTEVGYRSIDGANENPGVWDTSGPANNQLQADLYQAFFQTWSQHKGDWMKGAFLWNWEPNKSDDPTSFSPEDKPAEKIVSQYYHQSGKDADITIRVSEDAWRGDARFKLMIDGTQIGDESVVTARHSSGQWQDFTFHTQLPSNASNISVIFLNDAWGGNTTHDRNLHVQSATINGYTLIPDDTALTHTGDASTFDIAHYMESFAYCA